ncbi:MAG TPA: phosphopantothenoylcysteine decarboxylase [Candidatus Omnitrophota bacterium]|nr:phosphopantothenoylcysteine decarboxylase [Candidatus Omnitrophota bacterium]
MMLRSLKNKKILITCGPTWVALDSVRVISNISTGILGQRIAQDCVKKGAHVTLLEGPVETPLKSQKIKIIKFKYYDELFELLKKQLRNPFDVVIHLAAVSDYKIKNPQKIKISSQLKSLTLKLTPTKKIIHSIKKTRKKIFLVGFKLESRVYKKGIKNLTQKLFTKANCDLMVVNTLNHNKYSAYIVNKNGEILSESKSKNILSKKLITTIPNFL